MTRGAASGERRSRRFGAAGNENVRKIEVECEQTARFTNTNLEDRLVGGTAQALLQNRGIANARGIPDGEQIGRDAMMREIAVIVQAVELSVSADIEAGYGDSPASVAETIEAVLDLGAVGVNLEDRTYSGGVVPLYSVEEQTARIQAARAAAERRRIPLFINARTDMFLLGLGADVEERLAVTIERGRACLRAGADMVFVPVLIDPAIVRRVADGVKGPLSLMAMPGAPAADALFAAGASRVSMGNAAMLASLGTLREIANDVLRSGT